MTLSIRRVDHDQGGVALSVNGHELATLTLPPSRRAPGPGTLWIGGAGDAGAVFDVSLRNLRVVRAKRSP